MTTCGIRPEIGQYIEFEDKSRIPNIIHGDALTMLLDES